MIAEELRREQAHVDRAYERLEVLRSRARALGEGVLDRRVASSHQARYERDVVVHTSALRLAQLELGSLPLVFGRIDRTDGEHYHIGRVAVADERRTPLVVDWRAPVAEPFYRATPRQPLGLARRRHFRARGRLLLGLDDEGFDSDSDLALVGEGALLSALRRARTGRMGDIVATIQAEQDAVIRAPLEGVLVVQGGPGTGKTAVALHRAAYLLYSHRQRLEREGVLLVGPTAAFLRYVEDVLPSLGEQRVRLTTVDGLVPAFPVTATEPDEVARLKGDARMAEVLAGAPRARTPARTLLALLSVPERLASAAGDVLDAREQALLLRRSWRGWTAADLPLLDELAALAGRPARKDAPLEAEQRWELERFVEEVVASHPADEVMAADLLARLTEARLALEDGGEAEDPVYGHVLVDEAQDLSPMQWRMLRRRCPSGSMTVVGDLGQATGPWRHDRWESAVAALAARGVTVEQLTVNYRTPAGIAEFADRLRPASLEAGRPVRRGGAAPVVRRVPAGAVEAEARATAAREADAVEGTVGVVAPAGLLDRLAGVAGETGGRVSVAAPGGVKGIEFDAVVVVEPGAIAAADGCGALYVALTRATQRLTLVHSGELPPPLR